MERIKQIEQEKHKNALTKQVSEAQEDFTKTQQRAQALKDELQQLEQKLLKEETDMRLEVQQLEADI